MQFGEDPRYRDTIRVPRPQKPPQNEVLIRVSMAI